MSYTIFFGIINLILLSRLRLILRDNGINKRDILIITVIPLISLLFIKVTWGWFLLATYLVVYPFLMWQLEKQKIKLNRNRIATLIIHLAVVGLLSSPLINLTANNFSQNIIGWIDQIILPGTQLTAGKVFIAQVLTFGLLMILNEANIILRYLLKLMGLTSLGKGREVDQKEYNTGRLIGLLERVFVFLFVILHQFTAIGFILAAKGVTRFKDFENRTFAEYVLVGTLLSALLAMVMAFFVRWGIGG